MKLWKTLFLASKRRVLGRRFFDGQVRAYPTLRCNLSCEYCVNNHIDGGRHLADYSLLEPEEWIEILNRLNRDVILTGGEPLLYPNLGKVILGVNPKLDVTVYSNLMVPLTGDLSWLQRKRLFVYASYHISGNRDSLFAENVRFLKKNGTVFSVYAINIEGRERLQAAFAKKLGAGAPHIDIDEDQRNIFSGSSKTFRKMVRCDRAVILIAPDGCRYQCVSRMVRRVAPFENLAKEPLTSIRHAVDCPDFGFCAPCDYLGETKFTEPNPENRQPNG